MKWFLLTLFFFLQSGFAYNQPHVDLGYHNILVGGPLTPDPGWYVQAFPQYYYTDQFLDAKGKELGGVPSPTLNVADIVTEALYQSTQPILFNGKWGSTISLPAVLYSHVDKNQLGISSSGAGVGDLQLGLFLQWDTMKIGDRPIFAHRLAFHASFPTGKFEPKKSINPGNGIYYINPYWAATLYLTPRWAASWSAHYLWNAENGKTHVQAGQAFYLNYSMEYEVVKNFWLAAVGYFFQQFQNNRLNGVSIPNSIERLVAIGPGALYSFSNHFIVFGYLYFEADVINQSKGINFISRFFYHF